MRVTGSNLSKFLLGMGLTAGAICSGANPPAPKTPLKVMTAKPFTAAIFEGRDDTTGGDWSGKYGKEAFTVPVQHGKASYQLPNIVILRGRGETKVIKTSQPILEGSDANQFVMTDWERKVVVDDKRLPQRGPGMAERHATVFSVSKPPLVMRVDTTDKKSHRLSIYVLDYLRKKRTMRVEIKTLTGTVLDSRRVEDYSNGAYLRYRIHGSIFVMLYPLDKTMPELSGIFVDPI